jgi:two-component system, sensor histidine kinase
VVRTDKALLERILRNLVTNAIRYTEQGTITVSCQPSHSGVRIEVGDTGIGIPPEYLGEIFDEYVQLNNPERDRGKGLGLGLAIVDRIARLLGHRLRVHSVPGEGSVFSVEVPAGDPDAVEPMPVEGFAVAGRELSGLIVLVIDDEASVREAMQVLLGGWGCDVIAASSMESAIEQLDGRAIVPDVVLADYRLRERRTGVEAIRAVEAHVGRQVPALLITGDIGIDRLRDVDTSGYGVLHKPVKPARLRAFLKHAMKQKLADVPAGV